MRIYQPKNELGQALLNHTQIIKTDTIVSKTLTGGSITLTSEDIPDIINWEVKSVKVEINWSTYDFIPETKTSYNGDITIYFSDEKDTIEGLSSAEIHLTRKDSDGIDYFTVVLVRLNSAISSNDTNEIDNIVDEVIARGSYGEIVGVGAKLADSGIRKYILAGATDYKTAQSIMRTATPPIAKYVPPSNVFLEGGEFSYNLMSLYEGGAQYGATNGLFCNPMVGSIHVDFNLYKFSSILPNLEYGNYMFLGCDTLTTFTSSLPSLIAGNYMFYGCSNLTSFTSNLPSLKYGRYMFEGCKLDLDSVQNIAQTINTYNGNLTLGMGCTESTFNDHSTGWYDAVKAIENKGWTVAVQYNG